MILLTGLTDGIYMTRLSNLFIPAVTGLSILAFLIFFLPRTLVPDSFFLYIKNIYTKTIVYHSENQSYKMI